MAIKRTYLTLLILLYYWFNMKSIQSANSESAPLVGDNIQLHKGQECFTHHYLLSTSVTWCYLRRCRTFRFAIHYTCTLQCLWAVFGRKLLHEAETWVRTVFQLHATYVWAGETAKTQQITSSKDKDKDKDLFIDPQEFVVGYSKAPEQLQSSARPIYVILTLWRGRGANQPPYALLHRSSPRYALRHRRRRWYSYHKQQRSGIIKAYPLSTPRCWKEQHLNSTRVKFANSTGSESYYYALCFAMGLNEQTEYVFRQALSIRVHTLG